MLPQRSPALVYISSIWICQADSHPSILGGVEEIQHTEDRAKYLETDAPHVIVDGLADADVTVVVLHRHEPVLPLEHCQRSKIEASDWIYP